MGYLDNKGLEHYSWLVRNKLAKNQQMTKSAGAVAFCPAPETELEPIVDFMFTETPPASGNKEPNNPSTITGVNSVFCRCLDDILDGEVVCSTTVNPDNISVAIHPGNIIEVDIKTPSQSTTYIVFRHFSTRNIDTAKQYCLVAQIKEFTGSSIYHTLLTSATGRNIGGVLEPDSGETYTYGSSYVGNNNIVYNLKANETPAGSFIIGSRLQCSAGYTGKLVYRLYVSEGDKNSYLNNIGTISLGDTYYGGTINFKTGLMTVTHAAVTPASATVDISGAPAALPLEYADTYGRDITSADGSELDLGTADAGGTVVYKLATPQTVQLTPTQILSLPQSDPYVPRINTVYSDQQSVRVGWVRESFVKKFGTALSVSAAEIDIADGNLFTKTISENTSFAFAGVPSDAAASFSIVLTDGGAYTVAWPSSVKWAGGTAPTLTASGTDVLRFITPDGGTTWYGKVDVADAS